MHSGLPPLPRGQQRRADVNNSRSIKRGIRGVKDGVRSKSKPERSLEGWSALVKVANDKFSNTPCCIDDVIIFSMDYN